MCLIRKAVRKSSWWISSPRDIRNFWAIIAAPLLSKHINIYTFILERLACSVKHPCALSALELFFCDFSAARLRFVARLARSDSPQSRGPCPRADPPSPRLSRSASEVARSRLRGLPHAPYVFARTPVPIYCYLLLLVGLLPFLLPSNRLIMLYSYHYTYHVLLVTTIQLLVVGYLLQKHEVYVYTGPNTPIRTCSAIHHGCLCVPCEIADYKGSGLFLFLSYCYS